MDKSQIKNELLPFMIDKINSNHYSIYLDAFDYYMNKYGIVQKMPDNQHTEYRLLYSPIEELKTILSFLNITSKQPYFYWLGKFYLSLPLPINWKETRNQFALTELRYKGEAISKIRPSYLYIVYLKKYFLTNILAKHKMIKLVQASRISFFHINKRKNGKIDYINIKKALFNENELKPGFSRNSLLKQSILDVQEMKENTIKVSNNPRESCVLRVLKSSKINTERWSNKTHKDFHFKWDNAELIKKQSKKNIDMRMSLKSHKQLSVFRKKIKNFFINKTYKVKSPEQTEKKDTKTTEKGWSLRLNRSRGRPLFTNRRGKSQTNAFSIKKSNDLIGTKNINILKDKIDKEGVKFSKDFLFKSLRTVEWKKRTVNLPKNGQFLMRLRNMNKQKTKRK